MLKAQQDHSQLIWVEGGTFSLAPGACSGYATLYLSDEYGNPMAKGTSISVAAITTGLVIGSYTPTSVPDDGRYLADQATVSPSTKLSNYASLPLDALTHKLDFNVNIFATRIDIPITAPATCTGTGKNTAAFSVTITTPVTKTSYTADFGINY